MKLHVTLYPKKYFKDSILPPLVEFLIPTYTLIYASVSAK